jgi:CspA family cold shock protein
MLRGKVKFFNQKNRFGFITDERGVDYYVHAKDVEGHVLQEGDLVEFEVRSVKRGLEAYDVKKITL